VRNDFAPAIMPVAVEESYHMFDPEIGVEWHGVVDLREEISLHDLKTSGKKWTQGNADRSDQLTLYPVMVEHATGQRPEQLFIQHFYRKAEPEHFQIHTEREPADFGLLRHKASMMLQGIKAGLFPPGDMDGWHCSERWCGYWATCRYISDRQRRLPNR
jgi:hypothetical protein